MSFDLLDHLLDAVRSSKAPAGVRTRIVAIDGPGGSGKSARRVARGEA